MMIIAPLVYRLVISVMEEVVTVPVVVKVSETKEGSHRKRDFHLHLGWRKGERTSTEGFYAGERWQGKEEGVRSE